MLLLIAAVLANIAIAVCFKLYDRYKVDAFTAIIINYWISALLGSILSGHVPITTYHLQTPWTLYGIGIGFCFVFGFTITALCVRYTGMAITTAMQKMSLLVSAGYAVICFHEAFGIYKAVGIVFAVFAIFMITHRSTEQRQTGRGIKYIVFPILTLLFSGIIESTLYHVHANNLAIHGDIVFTTYAFSIAACLGTIGVVFRIIMGTHRMTVRDMLGGLALGIPNFFTIYLILALLHSGFAGSVLYPLLNILVLVLTAITGYYFFREKLSKVNLIGITIALASILLISLAK